MCRNLTMLYYFSLPCYVLDYSSYCSGSPNRSGRGARHLSCATSAECRRKRGHRSQAMISLLSISSKVGLNVRIKEELA